jgi:hypothetical protein
MPESNAVNQPGSGGLPGGASGIAVHANFWEDVRIHFLNVLTQAGIPLPADQHDDAQRVLIAYFNVRHKLIEARRRTVHWSKELSQRQLPSDVLLGVQLIEAKSIGGQTLEAHLSDRAVRTHTHDWLRNDWGIHHLHVHLQKGDDLLYVWVEPDALYFLDVREHGAMADMDLVEIVLANWPQLLGPPSTLKGGTNPTATEINEARRAGVQVIVSLSDGNVYYHRGGGVTTAGGSSARAVDRAYGVLRLARDREEYCDAHAADFARKVGLTELHLRYDVVHDVVIETTTGNMWMPR